MDGGLSVCPVGAALTDREGIALLLLPLSLRAVINVASAASLHTDRISGRKTGDLFYSVGCLHLQTDLSLQ